MVNILIVGVVPYLHVHALAWKTDTYSASCAVDYIDYVTGIGNTRMCNAATPCYGYGPSNR
jgi:hypothetical protein